MFRFWPGFRFAGYRSDSLEVNKRRDFRALRKSRARLQHDAATARDRAWHSLREKVTEKEIVGRRERAIPCSRCQRMEHGDSSEQAYGLHHHRQLARRKRGVSPEPDCEAVMRGPLAAGEHAGASLIDRRFHVHATTADGARVQLVDGGFTDWTQRLLSDRKERLLISGVGSELLTTRFAIQ